MEALARQSPLFRRACVSAARSFENSEVARHNRFLKPGEAAYRNELTPEQAVQKGAELVGEAILWTTGIAILIHQYYDEKREEEEKEDYHEERTKLTENLMRETSTGSEKRLLAKLDALEKKLNKIIGDNEDKDIESTIGVEKVIQTESLVEKQIEETVNTSKRKRWFWF